jgi:hypothetical protein
MRDLGLAVRLAMGAATCLSGRLRRVEIRQVGSSTSRRGAQTLDVIAGQV